MQVDGGFPATPRWEASGALGLGHGDFADALCDGPHCAPDFPGWRNVARNDQPGATMGSSEALSVSVNQRGSTDPGSDPVRIVVWVRGEHDAATSRHLSAIITRAARLDDVDVVVDLSCITFMDASTIGAVVDAHNRLRARSRVLSIRAPSPIARRLLDVCELGFLIEEHPTPRASAPALASWVAVPASDPPPGATPPPITAPASPEAPARAKAPRPGEVVAPVSQRAKLS